MGTRFGNDPTDGYNAQPYHYRPAWEKEIERHPDKLRSASRYVFDTQRHDLRLAMEVQHLGAIVMRVESDARGQLMFMGLSIFSRDEIMFD